MGKKPKGRVVYLKARNRYYVDFYANGKPWKIYRNLDGSILLNKKDAEDLLTTIRLEEKTGQFDIRKYTQSFIDTAAYAQRWLKSVKDTLTPGSYKSYYYHQRKWILPFFTQNPHKLQDIRHDTLYQFLDYLAPLSGDSKRAVMACVRTMLTHAWRSERIRAVPPFPKRRDYQIVKKPIKWLNEVDQLKIIEAIPEEHQPIFYFLKYTLRRPCEARAIHRSDYDAERGIFTIRRSISARQVIDKTKTGEVHTLPCHSELKKILDNMKPASLSPYLFTCKKSHQAAGRYSASIMHRLWNKACEEVGIKIKMYDGLKHSGCCQYINEKGLSESQLMSLTGHKKVETIRKYAKTEISTVRALMETPRLDQIRKRKTVESL